MRQRPASAPLPSSPVAAGWLTRTVRIAAAALAVTTALATLAAPASAAPDDGKRAWAIRPADANGRPDNRTHYTLQTNPGGSVLDRLLVTNQSKVTASFSIYATDAFNSPSGAFDLLPAATKPKDIGTWVQFPTATLTIPAGGTLLVPFKINVPPNATPGDHVGGVVVSLARGDVVKLDTRVALRLYLRLAGLLQPTLSIEDINAGYHAGGASINPFGKGSVTVAYTVLNLGNIRLRARQKVSVTGPFGTNLGNVKPADLPELLPGQRLTLHAQVNQVLAAGPLSVHIDLQPYGDPAQPIGHAAPAVSATAGLWAMKWSMLLLVIVVLLALVALLLVIIRALVRTVRRVRERSGSGTKREPGKDARKESAVKALAGARRGRPGGETEDEQ